ncbi:MAG: sporulation protein YunB [Syntrophomonadaceae bacterium]
MRFGRRKPKKLIWVGAFLIVLFFFLYIDFRLKASILQLSKSSVQLQGTEILNRIVNEEVVAQVKYDDMVVIHKDNDGKIVLIQPNTVVLNRLIASTVQVLSHSMGEMKEDSVDIPIGQLSGLKILAAWGPTMSVKIIPSSEVHVNLEDRFEQAGINQTRHLISMNIATKMKVAVPYLSDEVEVGSTVPLAETIIVGDVPSNYVNFKSGESDLYRFTQGK